MIKPKKSEPRVTCALIRSEGQSTAISLQQMVIFYSPDGTCCRVERRDVTNGNETTGGKLDHVSNLQKRITGFFNNIGSLLGNTNTFNLTPEEADEKLAAFEEKHPTLEELNGTKIKQPPTTFSGATLVNK